MGLSEIFSQSCRSSQRPEGTFDFRVANSAVVIHAQWNVMLDESQQVLGCVATIKDISNQMNDEKVKEQFLSTISHELRTPLAIIKNSISNMLAGITGKVNSKMDNYLNKMNDECKRMSFLVNNLVDMAKIESGHMPIIRSRIDLWELFSKVLDAFSKQASDRGISLVCEMPENKLPLRADEKRLEQVLWNLVCNALKFTMPGGSVILRSSFNEKEILIYVSDTGIGMDPEESRVIFNKFYQICRRSGAGYNGTGLGLPISKGIISAHGGRIWVESQKGKGSTFTIALPANASDGQSNCVTDILQEI